MNSLEANPLWNAVRWNVSTQMTTIKVVRDGKQVVVPCWWEVKSCYKDNAKLVKIKFLGAGSHDWRVTLSETEFAEAKSTIEKVTA